MHIKKQRFSVQYSMDFFTKNAVFIDENLEKEYLTQKKILMYVTYIYNTYVCYIYFYIMYIKYLFFYFIC